MKIAPGSPCQIEGDIAPLFGTAVVVNSLTAVLAWVAMAIDQGADLGTKTGCIGYREQFKVDLQTGKGIGQFFLDSELPERVFGPNELTLTDTCPNPLAQGSDNPLKRFDK